MSAIRMISAAVLLGGVVTVFAQQQVVINEIHYDSAEPVVHTEFIELHNPGAEDVDLSGWYFSDDVSFVFPAGSVLPAGGYAVICESPSALAAGFGVAGAGVYNWNAGVSPPVIGRLGNGRGRVILRTAAGESVCDVEYRAGFPWPTTGGDPPFSIELIHPSLDASLGGNWRPSSGQQAPAEVPVPKGSGAWEYRKALSEPSNPPEAWRDPAFPANDGSWLKSSGGAPFGYGDPVDTVLDDMNGSYTGIHMRHRFEFSGGHSGPLTLEVWSDDGFVAWINGTEVARFGPSGTGAPSFDAVAGRNHEGYGRDPEVVVLPNAGELLVPGTNVLAIHALNQSLSGSSDFYVDATLRFGGASPGAGPTPMARNSVYSTTAAPAIRQVNHAAVVAGAIPEWMVPGEPVRVTAKISDPDGVAAVTLHYQIVEPGDYIAIGVPRFEDPASWTALAMNDAGEAGDQAAGDQIYTAEIPAAVQLHRRLIRYRITAVDSGGASVRAPYPEDPQPNFAWFVYGGIPEYTASATPSSPAVTFPGQLLGSVPAYHLITTLEQHGRAMQVPLPRGDGSTQNPSGGQYGHSSYNWHGALCHRGRVYDHIRYRARGGVWRFAMGKNMWKFDFNKGHDFEARDNSGVPFDQSWRKLNLSACIQQGDFNHRGEQGLFESVGFRLFQLTGLPAEHTSFVHFRIVERASETGSAASQFDDDFQGLYLAIEQQDGQFLDEHGLPDGNLYKMENGTGDLNHQGRTLPSDRSDLDDFLRFGRTEAWWRENVDLSSYWNYRAIVDAIHHYDIGDGKNYFFFHNADTGRWTALPWDLDLTWADNMYRSDSGIAGLSPSGNSTEPFFSRIFGNGTTTGIAPLRLEMRNRVREILDLLFTPEQTGMLIDEMASHIYQPGQLSFVDADRAMWDYNPILESNYVNGSKGGHGRFYESAVDDPATPRSESGTFAGMIRKMKNYVTTRRNVMRSRLLTTGEENLIPETPVVTRNGDGPVPVNAMYFTSSGFAGRNGAGFAAMKWRIAEVTEPDLPGFEPYDRASSRFYEIQSTWESEERTTFSANVIIPPSGARAGRNYRVRVKHRDSNGRWSHWSDPVRFTAAEPDIQGYLDALVISRIMYDPAPPDATEAAVATDVRAYEWLEIMNTGTAEIDLTPVRLTKGVDFDFSGSPVTVLAPGARVIVAADPAAFAVRYGAQFPDTVVAGAWEAGDALNNSGEVLKLSYGAGIPIREFAYGTSDPWPAAGGGFGLELKDPASRPDHSIPGNWRPSGTKHGTPGADDSTPPLTEFAAWSEQFGGIAAEADTDGDGWTNLVEYALATSPVSGADAPIVTAEMRDGLLHVTLRVSGAGDIRVAPERAASPDDWTSSGIEQVSSVPDGADAAIHVYRVTGADGELRAMVRFRISLVPPP